MLTHLPDTRTYCEPSLTRGEILRVDNNLVSYLPKIGLSFPRIVVAGVLLPKNNVKPLRKCIYRGRVGSFGISWWEEKERKKKDSMRC